MKQIDEVWNEKGNKKEKKNVKSSVPEAENKCLSSNIIIIIHSNP